MNTLYAIRLKVDSMLDATIDPFAVPADIVTKLRREVQKARSDLTSREFRYFHRELVNQLPQNRSLRFLFRHLRGIRTKNCMPFAFDLENAQPLPDALSALIECSEVEKRTISALVSGTHFPDIENPCITNRTFACACELYPLSTLRWTGKNKPNFLTPRFVARLAILTALGLNASDIEQFYLPLVTKELSKSMEEYFLVLVHRIARKNGFFYWEKYRTYLKMPLGSVIKETRRLENIHRYIYQES